MPLKLVKNPDTLVNEIIGELETHLFTLRNKYYDSNQLIERSDLHALKLEADKFQEKIDFKYSDSLPEHLDERTELKDLLETIIGLEHVIKQLLPGRIKYIISELEEIKIKNNSEILRFVLEEHDN
jgi:predicted RNA-binding protein with EMAP domain